MGAQNPSSSFEENGGLRGRGGRRGADKIQCSMLAFPRGMWWGRQNQFLRSGSLASPCEGARRESNAAHTAGRSVPPPGKQRPDRTPRNPAGVWVECYFEAGGPGFKTRSSSTPHCNSRETYVINRPAERGERERDTEMEREVRQRERERGERERHSHRKIERRERERASGGRKTERRDK